MANARPLGHHRACLAAQGDAFAEALRGLPVDQGDLNATSWTVTHPGDLNMEIVQSNLDSVYILGLWNPMKSQLIAQQSWNATWIHRHMRLSEAQTCLRTPNAVGNNVMS